MQNNLLQQGLSHLFKFQCGITKTKKEEQTFKQHDLFELSWSPDLLTRGLTTNAHSRPRRQLTNPAPTTCALKLYPNQPITAFSLTFKQPITAQEQQPIRSPESLSLFFLRCVQNKTQIQKKEEIFRISLFVRDALPAESRRGSGKRGCPRVRG